MNIDVTILAPKVPKALKIKGANMAFPLSNFDDAELQKIGEQFTINLIKTANDMRKQNGKQ